MTHQIVAARMVVKVMAQNPKMKMKQNMSAKSMKTIQVMALQRNKKKGLAMKMLMQRLRKRIKRRRSRIKKITLQSQLKICDIQQMNLTLTHLLGNNLNYLLQINNKTATMIKNDEGKALFLIN